MDWFNNLFNKNKRIYLDYAAATPVLPEVSRAMERYGAEDFYNPNAIYKEGIKAREIVEDCRVRIARILGVAKESVHFTSGGTEANVLAVRGVKAGKVIAEPDSHPSLIDAIQEHDSDEVVLVSSPVPNNTLGRKIRAERKAKGSAYPLLHVDASQTAAYYDVSPEKLAADLMTLDATKLGGPKGIGALIVRRGVAIDVPPRGTPPVPLIVGFAKALELAAKDREAEAKRLLSLSEGFKAAVERLVPQAEVSLLPPHIVHVSIPGILPELLVLALDRRGILASAGPACDSKRPEPAETPVRFSFGRATTEKDLNKAVEILCQEAEKLVK